MKINEIGKVGYLANVTKAAKKEQPKKEQISDKVELSPEAKKLSAKNAIANTQRLEMIKKRIEDNFYDQDKVLQVVADRILQSPDFLKDLQGNILDKNI
ncbi:MAG: hypothetical protein Kow0037_23700 [Calditrichia bacterium]